MSTLSLPRSLTSSHNDVTVFSVLRVGATLLVASRFGIKSQYVSINDACPIGEKYPSKILIPNIPGLYKQASITPPLPHSTTTRGTTSTPNSTHTSTNTLPTTPHLTMTDWDCLPTSVRGAPPELRRLIRKRQNSESAKRCRQRRKLEKAQEADTATSHAIQMRQLEAYVVHLAERVECMQEIIETLLPRPVTTLPPPPPSQLGGGDDGVVSFGDTLDHLIMR